MAASSQSAEAPRTNTRPESKGEYAPRAKPLGPNGPGFAFLIIDVDGYRSGPGIPSQQLVGPRQDGFRPRELGWVICTPDGCTSGAFYFTDAGITGLPALSVHDPGTRHILTKVHGLPIGLYRKPVEPDCLFRSDRLLDVIGGLCEAAVVGGREVVVIHKGGTKVSGLKERNLASPAWTSGTTPAPRSTASRKITLAGWKRQAPPACIMPTTRVKALYIARPSRWVSL